MRGYSYDRRDVTGRSLANAYAQTLGSIFTEQSKPYEVEICVAEVGLTPAEDELYRLTYDGSVGDEPGYVAMGGQSESIAGVLKDGHTESMSLAEAIRLAVRGLGSIGGENGTPRALTGAQLEVAVLDRNRPGRTFRRLVGPALDRLLGEPAPGPETPAAPAAGQAADAGPGPTTPQVTAAPTGEHPQPGADPLGTGQEPPLGGPGGPDEPLPGPGNPATPGPLDR
jgi:proteasome alpha subunit